MAENIFSNISRFCHDRLLNDKKVLSYLVEDRKISIDSIKKFQIGLFPSDLRELFTRFKPEDLRSSGIIKHASKSVFQVQDLIIPIQDVYGNYIALAGRTRLSENNREKIKISKYMNSIYDKSRHLYGLNFAKRSILKNNKVYVVEGYFDVVAPHQHGVENVVAICGSFLSIRHLSLLCRYTNNIVLFFDNEEQAKDRCLRIIEKRKRSGISLSMINPLPKGIKDVDEFLRNNSAGDLLALLEAKESYDNIEPIWD